MPPKDSTAEDRLAYWRTVDWLTASVHELPAGVLDGHTGADKTACTEMLGELEHFRELCERLGLDDHVPFIEACSWHFEHYRHYLEPGDRFASYEEYIFDRRGPITAGRPPTPPALLRR